MIRPATPLSAYEKQCAFLVAECLGDKEIAEKLGKSLASVKQALRLIYRKYGVHSRLQLVLAITKRGVL